MTLTALLVLLVGLISGVPARSATRARAPLAAHFPGQPDIAASRPPVRLRVWALTEASTIAVVIILLRIDPVAALIASIIGAAVLLVITTSLVRYADACRRARVAVQAYAPRIAVPYAGKVGVHIGMWSPWIDQTGIPWCIVARTPALFHELAALYDVPIVQGAIPPSVRGALYPHGATANSAFIDGSTATHVFLGHGDSDKPLSASERVLQYDLVAVAGQAAIDRFATAGLVIAPERIRIIGRPQTEGIQTEGIQTEGTEPPARVLYAPTWRHADDALNVSSLAVADQIVQALLDRGCTVVFRRHFAGQNHIEAEAMIVRVDAMVSDVSGIVVDFMASDKPLVMYAAQFADPDDFRASHPTARAAYVIDRDLTQMGEALDAALGGDPLAQTRRERADHYLGGADRFDPARRFMQLVRELAGTT